MHRLTAEAGAAAAQAGEIEEIGGHGVQALHLLENGACQAFSLVSRQVGTLQQVGRRGESRQRRAQLMDHLGH